MKRGHKITLDNRPEASSFSTYSREGNIRTVDTRRIGSPGGRIWSFLVLWLVAGVLVLLFYVSLRIGQDSELEIWFRQFVDLNGEGNLPAWYSSALWLIGAYHCRQAGRLTKELGARRQQLGWFVVAAGCILLSLDEAASLHKTIGSLIDRHAGNPAGYAPVYTWVKVAAIAVLVVLAALLPFLASLPRSTALGLMAAGAIFLAGAMGMETLGSLVEFGSLGSWPLDLNWNRAFVIEEFLEMSGVILLSATVRHHMSSLPTRKT